MKTIDVSILFFKSLLFFNLLSYRLFFIYNLSRNTIMSHIKFTMSYIVSNALAIKSTT